MEIPAPRAAADHRGDHVGPGLLPHDSRDRVRVGPDSRWCPDAHRPVSLEPQGDAGEPAEHGRSASREGNPNEIQGSAREATEGDDQAL